MSNGSTILQTFPGFIALVVAGGALTIAFKVAGGIEGIKERISDKKPPCVEVVEPGNKLATYNPECHPKQK